MAIGSSISGAAAGIGQLKELRQRLFFVIGAIVVFRIGTFIPLPGIDPMVLSALVEQQRGTILEMYHALYFGIHYHEPADGERAVTGAAQERGW
jgi:preprotein translocase subunit SecY